MWKHEYAHYLLEIKSKRGEFIVSNKDLYIRSSSAEFLIFEQQKKKKELK